MIELRKVGLALTCGAAALAGGLPAGAAEIDYTTNLALDGTAILGAAIDPSLPGRAFSNPTDQSGNINDGNLDSGVDTWQAAKDENDEFYDFGGITFATAQDDVAAVRFYQETFGDGGWFDYPGLVVSEEPGDTDDGENISIMPRIQYTTDGGTTWTYVTGSSDNYAAVVNDSTVDSFSGARSAAIDFTFDPVSGINGIRVIGDGWGPAGGNLAGFIGFKEFEVYAIPEPSMVSMAGLFAAGLVMRRRRGAN